MFTLKGHHNRDILNTNFIGVKRKNKKCQTVRIFSIYHRKIVERQNLYHFIGLVQEFQ
jgi:hypothetical protein